MTVTQRHNEKTKDTAEYKTMRGVNNFVNRKVENYDLRLVEKKFEGTPIEVWVYEGGAGWEMTFHINKND